MSSLLTIDGAVTALREGAVVALPTDTVYGVAASIRFPDVVETLFALKRRPMSSALPVLVASLAAVREIATDWPAAADHLARAFWPGALTLVVGADAELCELVHAPGTRVGLRVPDDAVLREILATTGPLAVTSANEHGAPPCTRAAEVLVAFATSPTLIGVLDGGARDAAVSTVVEVTANGWRVLREGAISGAEIQSAFRSD